MECNWPLLKSVFSTKIQVKNPTLSVVRSLLYSQIFNSFATPFTTYKLVIVLCVFHNCFLLIIGLIFVGSQDTLIDQQIDIFFSIHFVTSFLLCFLLCTINNFCIRKKYGSKWKKKMKLKKISFFWKSMKSFK